MSIFHSFTLKADQAGFWIIHIQRLLKSVRLSLRLIRANLEFPGGYIWIPGGSWGCRMVWYGMVWYGMVWYGIAAVGLGFDVRLSFL